MSKMLFVTMGTSLFHSASWEPTVEPARSIPFYREWTEERNTLGSPEARHESFHSRAIKIELRAALHHDNAEAWAEALPKEPDGDGSLRTAVPLRYCAELATLLKLADAEAGAEGPREFLRGYDAILLVHDSDTVAGQINRPWIAAVHLECYLRRFLGEGKVALRAVPGISSLEPDRLLGASTGLGDLAGIVGTSLSDQVDLVISGGYKIYGVVLSPAVRETRFGVRLIYLHEESDKVLAHPRRLPASPEGIDRRDFTAFVQECLAEMRDADL